MTIVEMLSLMTSSGFEDYSTRSAQSMQIDRFHFYYSVVIV